MTQTSTTDKLTDLETRLAFQEDLLQSLNKRIAEQEMELARFQVLLQHLNEKVTHLQEDSADIEAGNQTPPHY